MEHKHPILVLILAILATVSPLRAANPSFESFNYSQFSNTQNRVNIKVGALVTNLEFRGTSGSVAGIYSPATTFSIEGRTLRLRPTNGINMGPITGNITIDPVDPAAAVFIAAGGARVTLGASATVGHVWTSTNVNGSGYWAAPAGGGSSTNSVFIAAGSNVTVATNYGTGTVTYTVTASLGGGAATLSDVTNVIADLTGTTKSNFISSVRLASSNYINQPILAGTLASSNYINQTTLASSNYINQPILASSNYINQTTLASSNYINQPTLAGTLASSNYVNQTTLASSNYINQPTLAGSNYIDSLVKQDFNGQGFYKGTNLALLSAWNIYADYDTVGLPTSGNISWRIRRTNIWTMATSVGGIDPDQSLQLTRSGLGVSQFTPMQWSSSNFYTSLRLTVSNKVFLPSLSTNSAPVSFIGKLAGGEIVETAAPDGAAILQSATNYTLATSNLQHSLMLNASNVLASLSTNGVEVVAGTGGGAVTAATSGGRQRFTVDFPAGGIGATNFTTIASGSATFGSLLVTNDVIGGMLTISNLSQTMLTQLAETNSTANTNITITLGNVVDLYLTNNASFTNFVGIATTNANATNIRIVPVAVNRTVVWPTFGTPTLGALFSTNRGGGGEMWTTLTNGRYYVLSISPFGTNVAMSLTSW